LPESTHRGKRERGPKAVCSSGEEEMTPSMTSKSIFSRLLEKVIAIDCGKRAFRREY